MDPPDASERHVDERALARCTRCDRPNLVTARVCASCGAPLFVRCYKPECSAECRVGEEFCAVCGLNLKQFRETHTRDLGQRIDEARQLWENGKRDEAVQSLATVTRDEHPDFDPVVREATRLMDDWRGTQELAAAGELHWQQGDRDRAAESYKELLEVLPDDPTARARLEQLADDGESKAVLADQAEGAYPPRRLKRLTRLTYAFVAAAAVLVAAADRTRQTPARELGRQATRQCKLLRANISRSSPPTFEVRDWFEPVTRTYRTTHEAAPVREWVFYRPRERRSVVSLIEGEVSSVRTESLRGRLRVRSSDPSKLRAALTRGGRIRLVALKPGKVTVEARGHADRREIFVVGVEALPALLPPVEVTAEPLRGAIRLRWKADPRTRATIVRFVVYRRETGEKRFTRLADTGKATTRVATTRVDRTCDPVVETEYRVSAVAAPHPRLVAKGPRESARSVAVQAKALPIVELALRGVAGQGAGQVAIIVVRRWVDPTRQWASATFRAREGEPIGAATLVRELNARVDFTSGYRVASIGHGMRIVVEERREPKYDAKGSRVRDESGKPVFVTRKIDRKYRELRVVVRDARGRTRELWRERAKPKAGK